MKIQTLMISGGLMFAATFPIIAQDGVAGQLNAAAQSATNVPNVPSQTADASANLNAGVAGSVTPGQNSVTSQINGATSTNAGLQAGSNGASAQTGVNVNAGVRGLTVPATPGQSNGSTQVNAGTSANAGLQAGSNGASVQNGINAQFGANGATINTQGNLNSSMGVQNGAYGQYGTSGQYGSSGQYGQYGNSVLNGGVVTNGSMNGANNYGSSYMGSGYSGDVMAGSGTACGCSSNTTGYTHARRGYFHHHHHHHRRCR